MPEYFGDARDSGAPLQYFSIKLALYTKQRAEGRDREASWARSSDFSRRCLVIPLAMQRRLPTRPIAEIGAVVTRKSTFQSQA